MCPSESLSASGENVLTVTDDAVTAEDFVPIITFEQGLLVVGIIAGLYGIQPSPHAECRLIWVAFS
jgi:hypothetical protein